VVGTGEGSGLAIEELEGGVAICMKVARTGCKPGEGEGLGVKEYLLELDAGVLDLE